MLYIVATPIGNLSEITFRAIEVLKEVDLIYAEDTRHTLVLLNHYDIKKPVKCYEKFSEKEKTQEIIALLRQGKNIALVSDAGMPIISDPGAILTSELSQNNIDFTVISGASACINALVLSGLDASNFYFAGFLPEKLSKKQELLEKIMYLEATVVFYVAVHDIKKDLDFLFSMLGDRKVAVVREISKKFETVVRGTLGEELDIVEKGEFCVVVEGFLKSNLLSDLSILDMLKDLIAKGIDKKEAIKLVATEKKLPKSQVYKESLKI